MKTTIKSLLFPALRSALLLVLLFGCGDAPTEAEVSESSADRVQEALLGNSTNCDRSADCASGVCQMGLCRSLLDSDQAWMEKAVADRVRTYIAEKPSVADELFGEQLAALDGGDPFGQGRFAAFIGHLGDERGIQVLQMWSKSPIERVAVLSVLARIRLRDTTAYAAGVRLLQHPSMAVQLDVLDALSPVLKDADAIDSVVKLLDSPKYRIRQRAVTALGRVSDKPPSIREALERLLASDSDGFLQGDILQALGR